MAVNKQNTDYSFRIQIEKSDTIVLDTAIKSCSTPDEINKARKTVRRLLNEYTPKMDSNLSSKSELALPQTSSISSTPLEGVRGLVHLHCKACGSIFTTFLKEYQSEFACKCGHSIALTDILARFWFTCPYCEKNSRGLTNVEDASITVACKCGNKIDMDWNPEAKEYQNQQKRISREVKQNWK